jgi:hypothetical protein
MKQQPNNNVFEAEKTRDRKVYPLARMNVVQCWCSDERQRAFAYIPITLTMMAEIRSGKTYSTIRRFSCGHKTRVHFEKV